MSYFGVLKLQRRETAMGSRAQGSSKDNTMPTKTFFTIAQNGISLYSGETIAGLEVNITVRGEVAWAFESSSSGNWTDNAERIVWLRYLMFAPSIGMIDPRCALTIDGQESQQISGVIPGSNLMIAFLNVVVTVQLPHIDATQLEEPWRSLRQTLMARPLST
jgi:hypothetical protein